MDIDANKIISGFDLCDAYNLDWKEVPFAMYNCKCFLNARDIGMVGDLVCDPNHPDKIGKLTNILDYYYNLEILVSSFINKDHGRFFSDSFINSFDQECKLKYGSNFDIGLRVHEKITRYVIYSSIIDKEHAILLFYQYDIKFVRHNASICYKDIDEVVSHRNTSSYLLKKQWDEIITKNDISQDEKKTIRCIIAKCDKLSHRETYDLLFPDRKNTKQETKQRYINGRKNKANALRDKYNLLLPSWKASS